MKKLMVAASLMLLLGCGGSNSPAPPPPPPPPANSAWWQASSDRRYLVNRDGAPTLIVGDAAHSLFVNLNNTDLNSYLTNRQGHGVNLLWVQALCSDYIANCRNDLSTYDGTRPFTSGSDELTYDVTTPNEGYWARIDSIVAAAKAHDISILFDAWETGILMPLARSNGNSKMRQFGAFLGNRYKDSPNIIWITGNDFQTWTDPSDNALMQNLMAGIASADKNHLQTTELDYFASGSLDNPLLAPYTGLTGAYDYFCSYGETLAQYNHPSPVPTYFLEGYYEYNDFIAGNVTTPLNLRTQAWWAALAGATAGQVYGSENVYPFRWDWPSYANSTGILEFGHLNSLLKSLKWYNLVPDQNHAIVTAGYGTPDFTESDSNCINANDYVTTSYLVDGTVSVSYLPKPTTITMDMARFSGTVTAKWFDPASGASAVVPGSPFANSGTQNFSSPGNNSAGDPDWVLQLSVP